MGSSEQGRREGADILDQTAVLEGAFGDCSIPGTGESRRERWGGRETAKPGGKNLLCARLCLKQLPTDSLTEFSQHPHESAIST